MPHPLLQKQNDPEQIILLKASAASYKNAKSGELVFTSLVAFLGVAYPFTYIILKNEQIKETLFVISFLVTVLTWLLSEYFKGNTSKGALFKEEFDVSLFQLPWKFLLQRSDIAEVLKLASQYDRGNGKEIKNWYSTNISAGIPFFTAIAICQRVNSAWDVELRMRYNHFLTFILIAYTIAVFISWTTLSVDGHTIFLIYFSTLSFYSYGLTLIRGNEGAIKKRKSIILKLDDYINNRKSLTLENVRDVQDEIYNIRQEPSKVPDYFFKRNGRIQEELEQYIQEINKKY